MNKGNKPMRDFIGSALAQKKVLDIGCGDCAFIDMFTDVDINGYCGIEINKFRLKTALSKGYRVIKCDLETDPLPFRDASFDVVILKDVLEHLYNFTAMMQEGTRVLKEDGVLFISVPSEWSQLIWDDHEHKRGFTLNSIQEFLSNYGFTVVRYRKYQDLIKFRTSRLKYTMRYLFKVLTGIDFITQGYLIEARRETKHVCIA